MENIWMSLKYHFLVFFFFQLYENQIVLWGVCINRYNTYDKNQKDQDRVSKVTIVVRVLHFMWTSLTLTPECEMLRTYIAIPRETVF